SAQNSQKAWEPIQKRIDKGESFSNEEITAFQKKYEKDLEKNPIEKSILIDFSGTNAFKAEKYNEAVALFNQAIDITKSINDTIYRAFYIYDLACLYNHIGYYPDAEPLFIKSLPTLAAVYGQSSLQYTLRFKVLAEMYVEMGNYTYAKSMNDALLYYFKTLKGEKDREYLIALNNDARINEGQGHYEKALEIFHKLLDIHGSFTPIDTADYITILNNTAEVYRVSGNYPEAVQLLGKALAWSKSFSKNSELSLATIYNNFGLCYKNMDDYSNAEIAFDNAINIYLKLKLDYSPAYTNALNNKGELYRNLGRYKQAFDLILQVIDIRKNSLGTKHVNYANALNNMALVFIDQHAFKEAEPYLLEAKTIYKEVLGENHPFYANCLNSLAMLYANLKRYKEAEELKVKAIEIIKHTVGESHERYAYFLGGSIWIYAGLGKYDKAIDNLQKANDIIKTKFGEKHIAYVDGVFNMAYLQWHTSNLKKAASLYISTLDAYKDLFGKYFESMSENEQLAYYSILGNKFETFNTFVLHCLKTAPKENHNELLAACMNYQLFIKSLLLNRSISARKAILGSSDTSLVNTYKRWIGIRQTLSGSFRDLDFQGSYWNTADLEKQADQLEETLKAKSNLFSPAAAVSYKDIQKKLGANEAAITIFRVYTTANDTDKVEYAALLLRKEPLYPLMVRIPHSAEFESSFISYYSTQMEEQKNDLLSYNRFWKPVADKLGGITKVYISADGVYNQLNLYTLQEPLGKKYILDQLTVCTLPNLTYILNAGENNPSLGAELFGYPDYEYDFSTQKSSPKISAPIAMNRFGFSELPALPGTQTEVEHISASLTSKGWKVNVFTKDAASEQQLKKIVSPKVLHIATHGFFLKNVDDSEDRSILGFESTKLKMNPLLRSGIMLAGASVVARDTLNKNSGFEQDGIFTAYEASLLNLSNTDLVVLSACETGLGVDLNNQGVFGLQRAFYIAGAKNLIMSLWVVDDDATQLLMSEFYKGWSREPLKGNISKAFTNAQLEVRKKYPHPYYWGAFTLLGN
ncbi:MAG: CHAT domain-containing protein, partial [Bacteroidia bacterium]